MAEILPIRRKTLPNQSCIITTTLNSINKHIIGINMIYLQRNVSKINLSNHFVQCRTMPYLHIASPMATPLSPRLLWDRISSMMLSFSLNGIQHVM